MEMNQQQGIDPSQFKTMECLSDGCEETSFYQLFEIRKLSSLVSPSGKEMIMQVPVFRCSSCGNTWKPEGA